MGRTGHRQWVVATRGASPVLTARTDDTLEGGLGMHLAEYCAAWGVPVPMDDAGWDVLFNGMIALRDANPAPSADGGM
jgi:hypothetical protein